MVASVRILNAPGALTPRQVLQSKGLLPVFLLLELDTSDHDELAGQVRAWMLDGNSACHLLNPLKKDDLPFCWVTCKLSSQTQGGEVCMSCNISPPCARFDNCRSSSKAAYLFSDDSTDGAL